MAQDRFDRLEGDRAREPVLPQGVQSALSGLNRFKHLEIGQLQAAARPQADAPKRPDDKILCLHCGQPNEKERQTCWACFRYVRVQAKPSTAQSAPEEVVIVLDGMPYRSTDPNLPRDVKVLMDRVRQQGFSPELVAEWRNWRATRHTPLPRERPFQESPLGGPGQQAVDVQAFQGQRVSVIRVDGKVYTSDDPNLTPELKQLFEYIDKNGVTPALLEYLRQFGSKVKFRPQTTANPSDGDVEFWRNAQEALRKQEGAGAVSPEEFIRRETARVEHEAARRRFELARDNLWRWAVGGVALGLLMYLEFCARTGVR